QTRERARATARRSGLTVEEWLASALAEYVEKSARPAQPQRRQAGDGLQTLLAQLSAKMPAQAREGTAPTRCGERDDEAARTAIALQSVAGWMERAEERLNETAQTAADRQERMASILSQALSALKERLDSVERRVADPAGPTPSPAAEAIHADIERLRALM